MLFITGDIVRLENDVTGVKGEVVETRSDRNVIVCFPVQGKVVVNQIVNPLFLLARKPYSENYIDQRLLSSLISGALGCAAGYFLGLGAAGGFVLGLGANALSDSIVDTLSERQKRGH